VSEGRQRSYEGGQGFSATPGDPVLREVRDLASKTKVGKAADAVATYTPVLKPQLSRAYLAAKKLVGLVERRAPKEGVSVSESARAVPPDYYMKKQSNYQGQKSQLTDVVRHAANAAIGKYQKNVAEGSKWFGLKKKFINPLEGTGSAAAEAAVKHPVARGTIRNIKRSVGLGS